jgi:DNA-binding SARP family transcriptional activator
MGYRERRIPMSALHIHLFGRLRVVGSDGLSEVRVTRAIQRLLAYLLLERHRTHCREKLASLLWNDYAEDRARTCLRTALCRLRRLLESAGLHPETYLLTTPEGEVGFNRESDYWLDVAAFEEHATRVLAQPVDAIAPSGARELEDALHLYTGELLDGLYDDWVLWERERLQRLYLNGLAHLLQYHKHLGVYERSLEFGRTILLHDPLREEIHREMIGLYLESGQRALAVQQYEICRERLAAELSIQPMRETRAMYSRAVSETGRDQGQIIGDGGAACIRQALQEVWLGAQKLQGVLEQLQQAIRLMERVDMS